MPPLDKDVSEKIAFRDTMTGAERMRVLKRIEAIKAEIRSIAYAATGNVHREVARELQDTAYEIRRGNQSPERGFDRFCQIVASRTERTDRRALSRRDARDYAERVWTLTRELMELRLPCVPEGPQPEQPLHRKEKPSLRFQGTENPPSGRGVLMGCLEGDGFRTWYEPDRAA